MIFIFEARLDVEGVHGSNGNLHNFVDEELDQLPVHLLLRFSDAVLHLFEGFLGPNSNIYRVSKFKLTP